MRLQIYYISAGNEATNCYICHQPQKLSIMQPVQLQKDKLELIEWITQLGDEAVILKLKEIMYEEETSGFTLTEEQKTELQEATARYEAGIDRGYSWEEIKESAARLKRQINEKRA